MTTVHPSITPPLHLWDVQIDDHLFLGKLCCFSDNFTTAESLLATSVEAAVNYTADLDAYDKGGKTRVADTIRGYNATCVQTGQTAYNSFAQIVTNLWTTDVNEAAWTATIDDVATAAKTAAVNASDLATKNAKDFIKQLLEGSRNPAARLFVAGTKVVLNFFATFLQGIWSNVISSLAAIKAAAELAVKYITGAGGFQSVAIVKLDLLAFQQNPRIYDIVSH